ncbi:hypothetical protein CC80DRAFT_439872 [Byssothecium circinans]|uniref:Zn(2)-C6 fungal-type domain-containing protein n=1 Tax=Byssothecium circinans TaxID=147558 RepID=A0A6A5UAB0_9PLEO|nr:hypothetical protein CC80DRAFT_439872 [Byssothecium circinans]
MSGTGVEKRGSAATVKACDSCRKRKRRCLWTAGASSCNHCVQLKENCTTTHVRKQRAKTRKDRSIEYERRIQNLEALLQERSAAQPHIQQQPLQPPDSSLSLSTWVDNLRSEVDAFPVNNFPDVDPESYVDRLEYSSQEEPSSAQTADLSLSNGTDDAGFQTLDDFEPSADFQVEAALLQDPSFQPSLSPEGIPIIEGNATPYQCNAYLPPAELGTSLLTEFLVDFNTANPLYRPRDITQHLRICYEGGSDGSALAWASIYVIFGIAHRSRGLSAVGTPEDDQLADWYLRKILPTVSGLLVAPPTFGLVQCLLGLAMLIRSSRQETPYSLYVSTALRIAQCFAYNSENNLQMTSHQDIEQQRRVFWLAFILDTDENIFSNVPITHSRDDITAVFPADDPYDSLGTVTAAEGNLKVNIFALRVHLVLLQSEAIDQVLSMKPRKRAPQETVTITQTLLQKLKKWRDNELFSRTPEELFQLLYRSDLLHTLSVEASYFATVFRLQAFLVLGLDPWVNPFSTDSLAKLAGQKRHEAWKDAEHLLGLLAVTPHDQFRICVVLKRPLIAALVTVLSHHLHSPPESAPSYTKMREYFDIYRTIIKIIGDGEDLEMQRARDLAMELLTKLNIGLEAKRLNELGEKGELGRPLLATRTSLDLR